jgi:hypothetical protein
VSDILGLDGPYVPPSELEIPVNAFRACDLSKPINVNRRFALVQSLEVAEHLRPEASDQFVDSLTKHSDIVLFSASPPGQGGENHVNERNYEYWRDRFAARGYAMLDWLRPRIVADHTVQYWYRYNAFLFVAERALDTVPASWRDTRVPARGPVADVSPALFRLRKRVVRTLPVSVQTSLSRLMSAARSAAP